MTNIWFISWEHSVYTHCHFEALSGSHIQSVGWLYCTRSIWYEN